MNDLPRLGAYVRTWPSYSTKRNAQLIVEWCQRVQRTEAKATGLGKFQVPSHQDSMHVLQVDPAGIFNEIHEVLVLGDSPRQQNRILSNLVPTRLKNRLFENHLCRAKVLDADFPVGDFKDLGDVKGTGGLVADGNEFLFS